MLLPACSNEIPLVSRSVSESAIQKSFQKIRINATTEVEYSQNITLVVSVVCRTTDWIHLKTWCANSVYFSLPVAVRQLIYGSIIYVLLGGLMFICLRLSHATQWVRRTVLWEYQWNWWIYTKEGGAQIDGGKWSPSSATGLRPFEIICNGLGSYMV